MTVEMFKEMIQEAVELRNLADSDFYSDSHLTELSEKFRAKFGCSWLQALDNLN